MSLEEFFAARMAEAEAAAKAASWQHADGDQWTVWGQRSDLAWVIDDQGDEGFTVREVAAAAPESVAAHVVLHDPARVLREVEADRNLLAALAQQTTDAGPEYKMGLRLALMFRAEVWCEHPDYDLAWKP